MPIPTEVMKIVHREKWQCYQRQKQNPITEIHAANINVNPKTVEEYHDRAHVKGNIATHKAMAAVQNIAGQPTINLS